MTNAVNYQIPIIPKTLRPYQNRNIANADIALSDPTEKPNPKGLVATDTVTLTQQAEVFQTYSRSSITGQTASGDGFELLRGLVIEMLNEQGIDYKMANDTEEMDISQLSRQEAQSLIADDSYFGVSQTSDRIADFAIALAGGDPTRLTVLKGAVEQGFSAAAGALGGWLPNISYQTHDAVMEKLDAWAQQGGV